MAKIKYDIFVPNHSNGLLVDADILKKVIGEEYVRIISMPPHAYTQSLVENFDEKQIEPYGEHAIFIENVFEHHSLKNYKRKILVSNPEWCTNKIRLISDRLISEFWHKTKFGMSIFKGIFPNRKHFLTGFTSFKINDTATNFDQFGHFSGKSKTRHTQELIDIWLQDPNLPPLKVQFYGNELAIPEWIGFKNLNLRMGFMDPKELKEVFSNTGIHLCTSQMEGFGHYINEARSIGALIITLDAPPMNELVDANSGILIKPEKNLKHNHGIKFLASKDNIKSAIVTALHLSKKERITLGENAKKRYFAERDQFVKSIRSLTR